LQIIFQLVVTITKIESKDVETVLMKTTIDFCRAIEGVLSNFFAKLLIDYLKLSLRCPVKKGFYFLEVNSLANAYLPPNFRNISFAAEAKEFGQLQTKNKKMNHLMTYNIIGETIEL